MPDPEPFNTGPGPETLIPDINPPIASNRLKPKYALAPVPVLITHGYEII